MSAPEGAARALSARTFRVIASSAAAAAAVFGRLGGPFCKDDTGSYRQLPADERRRHTRGGRSSAWPKRWRRHAAPEGLLLLLLFLLESARGSGAANSAGGGVGGANRERDGAGGGAGGLTLPAQTG